MGTGNSEPAGKIIQNFQLGLAEINLKTGHVYTIAWVVYVVKPEYTGDVRYRNVTVSGEIASGTSTLARQLAGKLGWEYINVGEWFRQYGVEHNLPLEEAGWSEAVDRQVDQEWRERLKRESGLVVEGWLAGFMAQDIPEALKVLLVAPMAVRVQRFVMREKVSQAEAKQLMQQRTEENLKKWRRMYGQTDFWRPDAYDLVIDTGVNDKEQTLAEVYGKITGINDGNFSQAGAKD